MNIDTARLRELHAKATPGPWRYRPSLHDDWGTIRGGDHKPVATTCMECRYTESDVGKREGPSPIAENGELIVAVINALPSLLDAYEERDRLRGLLAEALPCVRYAMLTGFAGIRMDLVSRIEEAVK